MKLLHQKSSKPSPLHHSKKLLREKTFMNWWKIWFSQKILLWSACFFCAKGRHASKFSRENFHEYPKNGEIRKSSLPQKFPTRRMFTYRAIYKTPVDEAMHHLNTPSEWPHWHCSFHLPVIHPDQLLVSVDLWERERGGKGGRKREEEGGKRKKGRGSLDENERDGFQCNISSRIRSVIYKKSLKCIITP